MICGRCARRGSGWLIHRVKRFIHMDNFCPTTFENINVCKCAVCAPLRRIKDASKERRRAVFKHRPGAHKKGTGHWWMGKLKDGGLNLSGQDAALPVGDR